MLAWNNHDDRDDGRSPGPLAQAMTVLEWVVVIATAALSVILPAAVVALTSTTSFLSALCLCATAAGLLALGYLLVRKRR